MLLIFEIYAQTLGIINVNNKGNIWKILVIVFPLNIVKFYIKSIKGFSYKEYKLRELLSI